MLHIAIDRERQRERCVRSGQIRPILTGKWIRYPDARIRIHKTEIARVIEPRSEWRGIDESVRIVVAQWRVVNANSSAYRHLAAVSEPVSEAESWRKVPCIRL